MDYSSQKHIFGKTFYLNIYILPKPQEYLNKNCMHAKETRQLGRPRSPANRFRS